MDCTKEEFVSALIPWSSRRCHAISVSEFGAWQAWLTLENVGEELLLTFSGSNPGDVYEIHLAHADHFEFGDARIAHESVRQSVDALFDQILLARIGDKFVFTMMFPRNT